MSTLVIAIAVLVAIAGAAALGARVERGRAAKLREAGKIEDALKLEAIAGELDAAHEAADVALRVGQRLVGGEALSQAVLEEESSPEAQDLLKRLTGGKDAKS